MRRLLAGWIVLAIAAGASLAADDAALSGDLAKVQGKWKAMVGPNSDIPLLIELKGKNVTISVRPPDGEERSFKGEVKLDEKASPKTWDWVKFTRPDGEAAPDRLGIYELAGDTLKICSSNPDEPRPTELKADEAAPFRLVTFTRQKD